jgi:hypothetical protein
MAKPTSSAKLIWQLGDRIAKATFVGLLLGGLLLDVPLSEARDRGGPHGGGGGSPIILIPPGGGYGGGGRGHMWSGGGSDGYLRHGNGDLSGNIGRRQFTTGDFSHPSHSQKFIYRKHVEEKKRDDKYSGVSKWRRADDDVDHPKHKRHRHRQGRYQYYYAGWWYLDPWWAYDYYDDQLSCTEARWIVRQYYDRLRTIECGGRIYTFTAVDNRGRLVEVSVNSITGAYWLI